jgi:predicted transcriptional regulator
MKDERTAVTVRIPKELMARAKEYANGTSFNVLMVRALEAEVRKREWDQLMKDTDEGAERIYQEHGLLSDSTPVIRELRQGIGRRD